MLMGDRALGKIPSWPALHASNKPWFTENLAFTNIHLHESQPNLTDGFNDSLGLNTMLNLFAASKTWLTL